MFHIELANNDPVFEHASKIDTPIYTEVGFIPNDPCGCKIMAAKRYGWIQLLAEHSSAYGCRETPVAVRLTAAEQILNERLIKWNGIDERRAE